jgi:endonuclease IV
VPHQLVTANDLPLGAHQSIAGGAPLAVERGVAAGCRVLQIFVKNNSRWVGKTIGEAEARKFSSPEGYAETLAAFDRSVGLRKLAAIHVNDSKNPRGARVDRHEHIGKGRIGLKGFGNVMTDSRLSEIPKFLETPKDGTLDFDRKNLATLRRLAVARPRRRER